MFLHESSLVADHAWGPTCPPGWGPSGVLRCCSYLSACPALMAAVQLSECHFHQRISPGGRLASTLGIAAVGSTSSSLQCIWGSIVLLRLVGLGVILGLQLPEGNLGRHGLTHLPLPISLCQEAAIQPHLQDILIKLKEWHCSGCD